MGYYHLHTRGSNDVVIDRCRRYYRNYKGNIATGIWSATAFYLVLADRVPDYVLIAILGVILVSILYVGIYRMLPMKNTIDNAQHRKMGLGPNTIDTRRSNDGYVMYDDKDDDNPTTRSRRVVGAAACGHSSWFG